MKVLVSTFLLMHLMVSPILAAVLDVPEQYQDISSAVSASQDGDTVLVAPGTYNGHIDFHGKNILLASHFILDSAHTSITGTVLSGNRIKSASDTGSVVIFKNGETSEASLVGFTISNGFGTLMGDNFVGGGILCINNSNPLICHNIIKINNALTGGGCAFIDSDPYLCYNLVLNNNAFEGGGIGLDNSQAVIDHNVIAYNTATNDGGGIYIMLSDGPVIKNSVIFNNTSSGTGGIGCFFAFPAISYNDLFANSGGNFGDCADNFGDTSLCLNFNKVPSDLYYNIIRDPGFNNPAAGDFHPLGNSPLIDAGSEQSAEFPWNGPRTDMGLYEVHYLIGDSNHDGEFNVSDVVFLIRYIFQVPIPPDPIYSGDYSCDRKVSIVDVTQMINYIFLDGPGPCDGYEWPIPCP
jgi:parallel beta-helix repeat protein